MASLPSPAAQRLTWASFALTDPRWLVHALAGSLLLWLALLYVPWIFTHLAVILALAILAAALSLLTERPARVPPRAPTVVRYVLVDATFAAFVVPPATILVYAALLRAEWLPPAASFGYPVVPVVVFVAGFYAAAAAIGHARERFHERVPLAAAVAVLALLALQGWRHGPDHFRREQARAAGVEAYRDATGKAPGPVERLAIGNSLHGFDGRVSDIGLDGEGRIVVAGGFSYYAGRDARSLVRLLPDGRLDPAWVPMPKGDPGVVAPERMVVASDGSVVFARDFGGAAPHLARVGSQGAFDTGFQPALPGSARTRDESLKTFALQGDGAVLVGDFRQRDRCLRRVLPSGGEDAAFEAAAQQALYPGEPAPHRTCAIAALAALPSGQVVVAGRFPAFGEKSSVVRLNADGTLDPAYRSEADWNNVSHWSLGPGGEMWVISGNRLERYLPDGRADPALAGAAPIPKFVDGIAALADGGLLVAGWSQPGEGRTIVRLAPDGRRDPAFGGPHGAPRFDSMILVMRPQPDGRIVVGGEFQELADPATGRRVPRANIARLTASGADDPSFRPR